MRLSNETKRRYFFCDILWGLWFHLIKLSQKDCLSPYPAQNSHVWSSVRQPPDGLVRDNENCCTGSLIASPKTDTVFRVRMA
jgi:hypothetical protein